MEFFFIEIGDYKFTIKELHQRFLPMSFDIGLWDYTSILKAYTILLLLHLTVAMRKH